jgi:short-subunit dehydrogenase
VISGASRGLGAALAVRFAAPGTLLGLIGRDAAALNQVAADCKARGASIRIGLCDVSDGMAMTKLLAAWDDAHPIDLAIANAGVTGGRQADGTMDGTDGARRLIEANLIGAINLVEPLLPRFQARSAGQFALIASLAALRGMPDHPAYSASKAGVLAYGEALRAALRPDGVTVSVILPGYFASALDDRWSGPKPLAMSLDAMADRVAAAIRRSAGQAMIPRRLGLVLRALALLPSGLGDRLIALNRLIYNPGEKK